MSSVADATEQFHLSLHGLLHHQGVFQVLQLDAAHQYEGFTNAQEQLMKAHAEFLAVTKRLIAVHSAKAVREAQEVAPIALSSPPRLVRQTAGFTTPIHLTKRELFPAQWDDEELECEEEVPDSQP